MTPSPPSSGRLPASCACLRPSLMSNVGLPEIRTLRDARSLGASWAKDFKVIDKSGSESESSEHLKTFTRFGMDQSSDDISTPVAGQFALPLRATFGLGDRVRKKSGAAWQGQVVGWYCTKLTPEGYAVESESHPGSVQIYPVAALERVA
jgi:dihydrofolate reductase (trimethoprim resistance protein)